MFPPLLAGILVGGMSRRMGTPKATIELDGQSLVQRALAAALPHSVDQLLLGGCEIPPGLSTRTRLQDVPGLGGPLAGILAAMRARPDAAWLIIACDMPYVTPPAIAWLVSLRSNDKLAVIPRVNGHFEPLLAIYEPLARDPLEADALSGRASPRSLVVHPAARIVTPPASLERCWLNVNTPEELNRLTHTRPAQRSP